MKNIILILFCFLFISCLPKEKLSIVYQEAVTLMRNEKFNEAIDLLQTTIPRLQRNYNYYYILGYCYIRIDNILNRRIANNFFMKAYQLDKEKYNNIYLLASTFEDMTDLKNAKKYFEIASQIWDSKDAEREKFAQEPYYRLAKVSYELTEYEQALYYVNKSLEIVSGESNAILLKGQILAKMGDILILDKYFEKAYKGSKNNDFLYHEYGKTLIELKEYSKAFQFFSGFLQNEESSETMIYYSYLELAYLELLKKNYDNALIFINNASKINHSNNLLRKYKAFYFWKTNHFEDANNEFKLYKYYAENTETVIFDTSADLTDFIKYFSGDVFFQMLLEPELTKN